MKFKDLKIGTRLALGFGFVCAALAFMAGQGLTMLGKANDATFDIANKRMPRIELVTRQLSAVDDIAIALRNMMLNDDAGERARQLAQVESSRKDIETLAQRSAAAAKEIKTLIDDSSGKVEAGTRLVQEAGSTMHDIVASVRRVTDILDEITTASQEQSAGIEQINEAITQMDDVTQQNAALVEQAAASAQSMQEQAGKLTAAVAAFRIDRAGSAVAAAASAAAPAPARAPARPSPSASVGSDWEEF